jgi:hypothetical protein
MSNKQNENDLYNKIPNRLFYSSEDGEDSILKHAKFNEKTLLILDFLYMRTDRRNTVSFYIKDMIIQCGFTYSTKKNESYDQFREILSVLHKIDVIETDYDFEDASPKELVTCSLIIDLNNKYIQLFDSEKDKIKNQTIDNVNNIKLLIYYCYLKCRMYKRPTGDDIEKSGGRAEVCFPAFKLINEDLHITDDSIDKYNKILIALDLIRYGSAGNWYYTNDANHMLRNSCNIYTLFVDEESAEHNIKEGIKFYKEQEINSNKTFTNSKEFKNNNKKLNGELGSIIKKEINGTITKKDISRKNEILASINVDEGQYSIQALFDANPDELLSSIYGGFNSDKKADVFRDLEIELCLIDEDEVMLVDYDYYKWVMINYNKDEHTYYLNCVNQHKRGIPRPKGLQNRKKVIEDDSAFIEEMGWKPEPNPEVDFSEFIDWDEEDELLK